MPIDVAYTIFYLCKCLLVNIKIWYIFLYRLNNSKQSSNQDARTFSRWTFADNNHTTNPFYNRQIDKSQNFSAERTESLFVYSCSCLHTHIHIIAYYHHDPNTGGSHTLPYSKYS